MTGVMPFRMMYLGTALAGLPLIGGAFLFFTDPDVGLGVLAGLVIGIIPFSSWHLAVSTLLGPGATTRRRILVGIITLLKFALLAAGLYFLVVCGRVDHWALFVGMLPAMMVCTGLAAFHRPDLSTAGKGEETA